MSSGGSGGGSSNTVTQVQQIPQFEQDFASANQNLAASLGSQPYPNYQGALIQGFTPQQMASFGMAGDAASAYKPDLALAGQTAGNAMSANPYADMAPMLAAAAAGINGAPGAASPFVSGAGNMLANSVGSAAPAVGGAEQMLGGASGAASPFVGAGASMLGGAFGASQPGVSQGMQTAGGALGQAMPYANASAGMIGSSLGANPSSAGLVQQYMSPYIQSALAPQITALNTQLGGQQKQIDAQAAGANAFGDARQGVQNSLANFYGNQAMTGMVGNAYNSAFTNAINSIQQQEGLGLQGAQTLGALGTNLGNIANQSGATIGNLGLGQGQLASQAGQALGNLGLGYGGLQAQAGQALGNLGLGFGGLQQSAGQALGNLGLGYGGLQAQSGQALGNLGLGTVGAGQQQQNLGLQGASLLGNLGSLNQQLGITGANALYNSGQIQQNLSQQELNTAYQQYLNQVNWPFQMLNVRESALSNSPYNMSSATTLPNANMTAQGLGSTANIAGLIGSLMSGGSGNAPFGGQKLQ